MPITFAQLGIPFPLFEASVDRANEYVGKETCCLCGKANQYCFRLGIGCAVMVACPECGTVNSLDVDDRESISCRSCSHSVPFPNLNGDDIFICYTCLRDGKAAITKDTELGMVSWEQAFEGVTHGIPGLNHNNFEMAIRQNDWVGARLPTEMMFELLQTPTYSTIQGDCWQFCCQHPMIFMGQWEREDFSKFSPDGDGEKFFHQIVRDSLPGLWEDELHDVTGIYVFRCSQCGRLTGHWDIA